ncbi:DUF4249 family protein, partial [Phocaeicola vulgatus]|nr:DUF4249 family protein [Phocaeicola vulgatus]
MKKALLLLSFVHLLAACTNDIEILPNDESQKLIVNALINANKTNVSIRPRACFSPSYNKVKS